MKARELLAKLLAPVMMVAFVGLAGTTIAAPYGSDEASQAAPPVDCKKTPENPKCKDKK